MNLIGSIQARLQNYQSNHFEKTRWGKNLLKYKNSYKGQKCFIIGNGPSLKAEDLQKIHELGIPSFACNRIYNIFNQTDWRPTYYASEDILILKNIQDQVSDIPSDGKFVPINLKWYEGISLKDMDFFWMDYNSENPEIYNLSMDITHGIRCRGTVTITCIQIAIYMGFTEIYLIGVDHNFANMIDVDGKEKKNNDVKDHFVEGYDDDIKDVLVHDMREPTLGFIDVETLSRKIKTYRVYNATRGGILEVFERKNLDELFKLWENI